MNPAALLLLAVVLNPGDVISIQANCQIDQGSITRASCQIVIKSPIFTNRPVFLTQGWERSNHKADGMLVRAFVNTGGQVKLLDGIQMSDGRVWANDHAFPRANPIVTICPALRVDPGARPPQLPDETQPPEKLTAPKTDNSGQSAPAEP